MGLSLAEIFKEPKYEDFVDKRILKKMGMANSGVNITKANRDLLVTPYYTNDVG